MTISFPYRMALALLLVLPLTIACGGGKDDDEESSLRWQCYSNGSDNSCECYGVEPGTIFDYEGTYIVEVDECRGYDVCMSYYDAFFEEERCDCGPSDYMPWGDEADIEDLTVVSACPED